MALVTRQTIAERQASIDATITTNGVGGITAALHREILQQDMINSQPVNARITLAGAMPTVTLNNTTPVKIPAGAVGGVADSAPSLFDSSIEISASSTNDWIEANIDCHVQVSGSLLIEPPSSSSLISVDIVWYDASIATEIPLGFSIDAVQQAGKGTHLTIPSFPFNLDAGDRLWLTGTTDNGTPELCNVEQAYLGVCLTPYGR